MEAASIAASAMEKGLSVQAATAEAERILYGRLFPGLSSCGKRYNTTVVM